MGILQLSACSLTAHTPPENIQHEGCSLFCWPSPPSLLPKKKSPTRKPMSSSWPLSVTVTPTPALPTLLPPPTSPPPPTSLPLPLLPPSTGNTPPACPLTPTPPVPTLTPTPAPWASVPPLTVPLDWSLALFLTVTPTVTLTPPSPLLRRKNKFFFRQIPHFNDSKSSRYAQEHPTKTFD